MGGEKGLIESSNALQKKKNRLEYHTVQVKLSRMGSK